MRYADEFDTRALRRASDRPAELLDDTGVPSTALVFSGAARPRAEALFWLSAAAEIEHALMVQYLFAAATLDPEVAAGEATAVRAAAATLRQIAREEMGHFITVQNLLLVLGGAPNFSRTHAPYDSAIQPFRFRLEPVSLASLAKYVVAESPDVAPEEIGMLSPARRALLRDTIGPAARAGNDGQPVRHVGPIFARLVDLVENRLADDDFQLGRTGYQAAWDDWGYSAGRANGLGPASGGRVLVHSIDAADPAGARAQIVAVLRSIGDQGEFVDTADDLDESHFERFLQIYEALDGVQRALGRMPVRPVANFPNTTIGREAAGTMGDAVLSNHLDAGRITAPRTRAWAQLFDLRYRRLVGVLSHGLLVDGPLYVDAEVGFGTRTAKGLLHAAAFAEMRHLAMISGKLVALPLREPSDGRNAGPPFALGHTTAQPPFEVDRWRAHADLLGAAQDLVAQLRQAGGMDADDEFLAALLAADAAEEAVMRTVAGTGAPPPPGGGEVRFPLVVASLEEAVRGFDIGSDPEGATHGNFWLGKTRDAFVETIGPGGGRVVVPGDAAASPLVRRIIRPAGAFGAMPRQRPAVPDTRQRLIAGWIADGAPDGTPLGRIGLMRMPSPKPEPRPDMPPPIPPPGGAPTFERDIAPLFEDIDRNAMRFLFDLGNYEDVRANAEAIAAAVASGRMPCQPARRWDDARVALLRAWIDGGFPREPDPRPPTKPEPGPVDPPPTGPGGPWANHRWRATAAPVASRTDDIAFVDAARGWLVNANGEIHATEDGGRTWTRQAHYPGVYLRSVAFSDALTGWVGTFDPGRRLFHTRDGGAHWEDVANLPGPDPIWICGLCTVGDDVVYAAGTNREDNRAAILKTVDGGANWSLIDMDAHAAALIDIHFTTADEGWVVGGVDTVRHPGRSGVRGDLTPGIFRTLDGGATWRNVIEGDEYREEVFGLLPQGEWGWKIQIVDADVIVVATQNYRDGAILRSDDGGVHWRRLRINDRQRNSNLEGIGFLDRRYGWVGGWGNLMRDGGFTSATDDGGDNWSEANFVGRRLNRFRLVGTPPTIVYASGDTVYKYSDEQDAPLVADAAVGTVPIVGVDDVAIPVDVPPDSSSLTVRIWDHAGRFVRILHQETDPATGRRTLRWAFDDAAGVRDSEVTFMVRVTIDDVSRSAIVCRGRPS